jgi:hypothetical protein
LKKFTALEFEEQTFTAHPQYLVKALFVSLSKPKAKVDKEAKGSTLVYTLTQLEFSWCELVPPSPSAASFDGK